MRTNLLEGTTSIKRRHRIVIGVALLCVTLTFYFTYTFSTGIHEKEDTLEDNYANIQITEMGVFKNRRVLPNERLLTDVTMKQDPNFKKVEKEISVIREQIRNSMKPSKTNMHNGKFQSYSKDYKENDSEHHFQEIINASPVVLFMKDSDVNSQYLNKLIHREFEIYPEMVVIDLDQSIENKKLGDIIRTKKIKNPIEPPYLFINGVPVIENDIQEDIIEYYKNSLLLGKFQNMSNGKVIFAKKDIPSNY